MNPVSCARRGVALILVLGLVAMLAILTTALVTGLRTRLLERAGREMRCELMEEARGALAAKRAELAEYRFAEGALYGPGQGWAGLPEDAASHAKARGIKLEIRVTDESGLFAINSGDEAQSARLFHHLGVPDAEAKHLAATLADWIDEDDVARPDGAERADYAEALPPGNRPLADLRELRKIKGFSAWFFDADGLPNARFAGLAKLASVNARNTKPNINAASAEVIRALCDSGYADAEGLVARRDVAPGGGFFKNAEDMTSAGAPEELKQRVGFSSQVLRIDVRASRAQAYAGLVAIINLNGSASTGDDAILFERSGVAETDESASSR